MTSIEDKMTSVEDKNPSELLASLRRGYQLEEEAIESLYRTRKKMSELAEKLQARIAEQEMAALKRSLEKMSARGVPQVPEGPPPPPTPFAIPPLEDLGMRRVLEKLKEDALDEVLDRELVEQLDDDDLDTHPTLYLPHTMKEVDLDISLDSLEG